MQAENTFGDRLLKASELDTLHGAAEFVGVVPMTIRAWVQAGLLQSMRLGNCVIVSVVDAHRINEEMRERRQRLYAEITS